MPTRKATADGEIAIPAPKFEHWQITIQGETPLLVHRFSEESLKKMEDKQQGRPTDGRQPRNPETEMEGAQYRLSDGGHGFPGAGVKLAVVTAGYRLCDVPMTRTKAAITVPAKLLRIKAPPPTMNRAVGRLESGVRSPVYRPEYWPWEMTVPIVLLSSRLSIEQLLNLFQYAGFGQGLGDWRVEKDGTYGMFKVTHNCRDESVA